MAWCHMEDGMEMRKICLWEKFPAHLILRSSEELTIEVIWFDIIQLFLLFTKSHVYVNKTKTIPALKADIRRVFAEIMMEDL